VWSGLFQTGNIVHVMCEYNAINNDSKHKCSREYRSVTCYVVV